MRLTAKPPEAEACAAPTARQKYRVRLPRLLLRAPERLELSEPALSNGMAGAPGGLRHHHRTPDTSLVRKSRLTLSRKLPACLIQLLQETCIFCYV